jgi:hypothetical protein
MIGSLGGCVQGGGRKVGVSEPVNREAVLWGGPVQISDDQHEILANSSAIGGPVKELAAADTSKRCQTPAPCAVGVDRIQRLLAELKNKHA